ncbi:Nitrogen fixation protein FixI [Azospirillaceae bacterium]
MKTCDHCGLPVAETAAEKENSFRSDGIEGVFCCLGCATAYAVVRSLGLVDYYARRTLNSNEPPLRPEMNDVAPDYELYIHHEADGTDSLHLMVEGIQCGACVWLIETVLARQEGVVYARLNMTTRRLTLRWRAEATNSGELIRRIAQLGYRLKPFNPKLLNQADRRHERELVRAMAVAGFAAGNVMLMSVAVWAGHAEGMGPATRTLLHWISALIVLPTAAYAVRPFLKSAWGALRHRRANMDVPISIGVLLTTTMSLVETMNGAEHVYFDSSITLLFFLLVGRVLDQRARGHARSVAEHLLTLKAHSATVIGADGQATVMLPEQIKPGMTVLVAVGDRAPVDGRVLEGTSELDASLITGETTPARVKVGDIVFAGVLNMSAPVRLMATATGEATLLAEIVRLMDAAEQGRAHYVVLADRVAKLYTPFVHLAALTTFLGWTLLGGLAWQPALLIAVSVLIITCPCALALAVSVVQVVASGRLFDRGVLLKSPTALERLAHVDCVAFDKTGTLTLGRPSLLKNDVSEDDLMFAASLAGASRHPLARALCAASPSVSVANDVREEIGAGLILTTQSGDVRLGNRRFVGVETDEESDLLELWLSRPHRPSIAFRFRDELRDDAVAVIAHLKQEFYQTVLLSGDRFTTVQRLADRLAIDDRKADLSPPEKVKELNDLAARGKRVLMVGDGLNDAPALVAAYVSMSPSSAVDISQTSADIVFRGSRLAPVADVLAVARQADRLVKQNIVLSLLYNIVMVPLAVAGWITPFIAAVAMSTSSFCVVFNSLRIKTGSAAYD